MTNETCFFCTKDPQILRNQMIPWSFNKTQDTRCFRVPGMIFIRDKAHLVATRATPPAVAEDPESSSARDGEVINRVNSWDGYWLQDKHNIHYIYIIYIPACI